MTPEECPICDRELGIDDGGHIWRCIAKRIASAIAEEREALCSAILAWGRDRVQSDRHTSEEIVTMLRARTP